MGIITNKIYICLPYEKEIDKLDWHGLSTEEYNGKTYYKIPSGGSSSDIVKKITFETLYDNVTVTLNIVSSSEETWDNAYACDLDGNSGYSNAKYEISGNNKSITCEYVVPNKGSHWIYIGYKKDGSGSYFNDCGYFSIDNSDKEYVIRQPKEVYLASDKMNEITYGSKKILEHGLGNTISWETLTWNKSNNSYTYNTKGKLHISYNNKYTYLTNSPESINTKPYNIRFDNINTYYGTSYNCTYKLDLSDLDTSNINDMHNMFFNCNALTSVNVTDWNTSKVTNMEWMFLWCNSLSNLDVSRWNTSNVTNANRMFENCFMLSNIDVSRWNTSKMNNVSGMFNGCRSLTSLDLSGWDTSSISEVSEPNNDGVGLFKNCENLAYLKLPKNFITSKVTNISDMFNGCKKLTSLDLSGWDTSNITEMNNLFKNSGIKIIDISNWDLSSLKVSTDKWQIGFKDMFKDSQCETIKLPNMNFGKDVKYNFGELSYLKSFYGPELVNTNITIVDDMFYNDKKLNYVDMHDWDFSNVTYMRSMFGNCIELTTIDTSTWNVSKVTNMYNMFGGCSSLTSLDLSNWDVSNVTSMNDVFRGCSELKTLIAGHESDTNVTALNGLKVDIDLSDCTNLNVQSIRAICTGLANLPSDNEKTITVSKTKEDDISVKIAMLTASIKNWNIVYK